MLVTSVFLVLFSLTIVNSMPCPSECICKPIDMVDVEFTRMSYLMDCSNQSLRKNRLIYRMEEWSINEDEILEDDDDDDNLSRDYAISIDLSNSPSMKKFTSETIQLTGFSFSIQSLSLTNQPDSFTFQLNAFNSYLYEDLKRLNLSSCCQRIPKECSELFRPLKNLQILDLSESDLYKTCLNTPGTISSKLTDLLLRNNIYDQTVFSKTSGVFNGVQTLSGKLDLQNSLFQMANEPKGDCLFNLFERIEALDLSSIQFQSDSNKTEEYLAYLLQCQTPSNGEQLLDLYLRRLELVQIPVWLTNVRFPLLRRLDLSENNLRSIDISTFLTLRYLSFAYNPLELEQIVWRRDLVYESINLRGTIGNRRFDLSRRLSKLFGLTATVDYSENEAMKPLNLTYTSLRNDVPSNQFSLNISRTNVNSYQLICKDLHRLDISWNSLTKLNLDKHQKLSYLDCSNQYLKRLKFDRELSDLIELKCSNNSLRTIENFSLLDKEDLKSMDLSRNSINSLTDLFSNLSSRLLRTIDLKFNAIKIIPSKIFHKELISLYEINLSWNQIHTIKREAFQAPNLQILDLTGNPLTNIEPQAILTASLRLFYVFNNTQQLTIRCQKSKSNDNLLSLYANWLKSNGTRMKNDQIEFDRCLNRYVNQTKFDWMISKGRQLFGHYILYMAISLGSIAVFFGAMYLYRGNKLALFTPFARYKRLDENLVEMTQRPNEDEEIVMNLQEPPFNKLSSPRTHV